MAALLSLPFRISPAGQAVSVEQGDDEYYRQQIATILLTVQGERILTEELGMPDMAFDGFRHSTFQAQVEIWLPEITELQATVESTTDRSQTVVVNFDVLEEQR